MQIKTYTPTCAEIADQLVRQALLVKLSENTFELAPAMKQRFQAEAQVEAQVDNRGAQVGFTETDQKILSALSDGEKSGKELLNAVGYKSRTGNFKRSLEKLLTYDLIRMSNPDNPTASNQKYVIAEHGLRLLKVWGKSSS